MWRADWRARGTHQAVAKLSFHPAGVRSLRFANNSYLLAVGLTDGSVRLAQFEHASLNRIREV